MIIKYVIYSKDRASQLDLLLRSIDKFAPGKIEAHVIYKSTNSDFQSGYNLVNNHKYDCLKEMLFERDFREDTLRVTGLFPQENKLIGFLTDDSVFYSPFPREIDEVYQLMIDHNCNSFSLRNGLNTDLQCHYKEVFTKPRDFLYSKDGVYMWDTSKHGYDCDYGRPVSIDGNFFMGLSLITSLLSYPWNCPRTLDGIDISLIGPRMMCFDKSVVVNMPVNLTAGGYADNWGHHYQYSLEMLNDLFLQGSVIDLDKIDFSNIISSHQERELFFTGQK